MAFPGRVNVKEIDTMQDERQRPNRRPMQKAEPGFVSRNERADQLLFGNMQPACRQPTRKKTEREILGLD